MKATKEHNPFSSEGTHKNSCLSCGTSEDMGRRKYCSIECRQRLRYNLNLRTGLLRALNTRYATFYFTNSIIILDVLPYGSEELFSYFFSRTAGRKPVELWCNHIGGPRSRAESVGGGSTGDRVVSRRGS